MSNKAPKFVQPYVPGMNAAAAARPKARRTVVRWLGVARLSLSGVTRRRASRASQGRCAAGAGRGRSCDSGMIVPFYARSQAYPTPVVDHFGLPRKAYLAQGTLVMKPLDRVPQRLPWRTPLVSQLALGFLTGEKHSLSRHPHTLE